MRTFPPPAAIESPQPAPSVVRDARVSLTVLLIALQIAFVKVATNDYFCYELII